MGGVRGGELKLIASLRSKTRDAAEPDLAGNERCDRDLVGGVVDGGRAAAGPQRLIGQSKRRKAVGF